MLVHPSSDGDDDKSKWVQTRLHEESYTGDRGNSRAMMSNGIEFLDLTGSLAGLVEELPCRFAVGLAVAPVEGRDVFDYPLTRTAGQRVVYNGSRNRPRTCVLDPIPLGPRKTDA